MKNSMTQRLLTPGPMTLQRGVKLSMFEDLGSRTEEFRDISYQVQHKLLQIADAQDSHEVVMLPGSGTTITEAVFNSFLGAKHKILVCINGIYGQRASDMLRILGIPVKELKSSPGMIISVSAVRKAIMEDTALTHIYFVHSETTYGILNPYQDLLKLAQGHGLITMIDSMSAFGAADISGKRDQFDVLITSGNKCIEAPPGVAFAFLSNRFLSQNDVVPRTYALDLKQQLATFKRTHEWRFTPPTHVIQSINAALDLLLEEGVHGRYARYRKISEDLVWRLKPLGMIPLVEERHRFPNCVCFTSTMIQNDADFADFQLELKVADLYIYSVFEGKTFSFRIGCIGAITTDWIDDLESCVSKFVADRTRCLVGLEQFS